MDRIVDMHCNLDETNRYKTMVHTPQPGSNNFAFRLLIGNIVLN